ncbi:MAG: hypothetical protein HVN35_08160 [Methanobacteriaceae archaeon]|nr:hypothetical protein [Methanobacteriaceae archaeon]
MVLNGDSKYLRNITGKIMKLKGVEHVELTS